MVVIVSHEDNNLQHTLCRGSERREHIYELLLEAWSAKSAMFAHNITDYQIDISYFISINKITHKDYCNGSI